MIDSITAADTKVRDLIQQATDSGNPPSLEMLTPDEKLWYNNTEADFDKLGDEGNLISAKAMINTMVSLKGKGPILVNAISSLCLCVSVSLCLSLCFSLGLFLSVSLSSLSSCLSHTSPDNVSSVIH